MEKWYVAGKKADFDSIANKYGISPFLARIMRNRDVITDEEICAFLKGTLEDLPSPFALFGMERAVELLRGAIEEHRKIKIIGDYDVDGICSSFILKHGISKQGGICSVAIPHRMKDGYGLNETLIEEAIEDGAEVILTCDNGIAAIGAVALAKEKGMTVIVTDHHEVPFEQNGEERVETLPNADCIIDPKQEKDTYPNKNICGAVVAMKVMQAMNMTTRKVGEEEWLQEFLPYAALATVCDVMPLLSENRIIVKEGLKLLREKKHVGLDALMIASKIRKEEISAYHLGFVIGPSLNATGRLDSAMRSLSLLEAEDESEATVLATGLRDMNDARKAMTVEGVGKAISVIQNNDYEKDTVLVVYLKDCHESLAGIIAGRIKEQFNKPTIILTDAEEGVKGSGRSIEEYDMFENLTKVKDIFTKFGGHKMAAGVSLPKERIDELRIRLNENSTLTKEDLITKVHIDIPLPISYATLSLARELEILEPFGVGNSKPLFAQKDVTFLSGKRIGAEGKYAKYVIMDDAGNRKDLMCFLNADEVDDFLSKHGNMASITYQLGVNSFRGNTNEQLILQNYC